MNRKNILSLIILAFITIFPSIAKAGFEETYKYDAASNMTEKSTFNGEIISYEYDRLTDKITKKTMPGFTVTYEYDNSNRLWKMHDSTGTTVFTYDSRDRLLTKSTPWGTLNYVYTNGKLSRVYSSNPNGIEVSYRYHNLNGFLEYVDDSKLSNNVHYTYDAAGDINTISYPNGIQQVLDYDSNRHLTSFLIQKNPAFSKGFYYILDAKGNKKTCQEKINGSNARKIAWTYDDLYRLVKEEVTSSPNNHNGTIEYGYDDVGNRISRISTYEGIGNQNLGESSYDANDRFINGFTYDNNGNVLTDPRARSYTYDAENHLLTAKGSDVDIEFKYDGFGNRVGRKNNLTGEMIWYLVDSNNLTGYSQVVEELDGGKNVRFRYVYGSDLISQTDINTSQTVYYCYDGIGSVRLLTNDNGEIMASYDYDAFGDVVDADGGSYPNNYLFHGEQYDRDLKLYYLRARYMDKFLGRFWSMDPFEGDESYPSSLNKYVFALNNPVNVSDPSGRQVDSITMMQTVAIIGILYTGFAIVRAPYLGNAMFDAVSNQIKEDMQLLNLTLDYYGNLLDNMFLSEANRIKTGIKSKLNRVKEHISKIKQPPQGSKDPRNKHRKDMIELIDQCRQKAQKYLKGKTQEQYLQEIEQVLKELEEAYAESIKQYPPIPK